MLFFKSSDNKKNYMQKIKSSSQFWSSKTDLTKSNKTVTVLQKTPEVVTEIKKVKRELNSWSVRKF